jgi:hypothetical protein
MTTAAVLRTTEPAVPAHWVDLPVEDFSPVCAPGVNLALWRRRPIEPVAVEVARLPADAFPDLRRPTSAESCAEELADLVRQQGLDPAGLRGWIADMTRLTRAFARVAGDRPPTLRIETLAGDGCRRFHVDRTHLRLICTYLGPGSEWLANEQVDRGALESGQPNAAIVRYGSPNCLRPFWVALMKGDRFPGNKGNGLVHRSPPIEGSGRHRVLFCLDA